jgi:RNA-directed DNA polymerase
MVASSTPPRVCLRAALSHRSWPTSLLDGLDKEPEKRGHQFVRYADDFLILVKSWRAGERLRESIQRFLERKLQLKVNQSKSQVAPPQ